MTWSMLSLGRAYTSTESLRSARMSSRYARSYLRVTSDGSIPSSRARRMILSSTSVMFCTYLTEKRRARGGGRGVKLGVGLGVPGVREVVDRRPADEQRDPA